MSRRIDKTWVVFCSIENAEHDRCVDFFYRPDLTFGFEEFRRDVEDAGAWTPTQFYSGRVLSDCMAAYAEAEMLIAWCADELKARPELRRKPFRNPVR
jgi:hypothetical protein